ncbi:Type IV leader peptidase family protein [Pedobacter westerhofensis]|uniref:Type IV leader peptidase family protein n=1 Tax=Pedobacter westerhofensis TaxID=425512 RepID=A0A521C7P7_9SPHI|nr:prepilin peptidase [Pedobacter westerhofensis]SMO55403.1 Type IV leader peptidase family protein [Pedobacter westerhofensis]
MLFLTLFVLLCLGFICYQDMRYRAVYWICFPLLAISMFILKLDNATWKDALIQSLWALAFFGIQLFALWGYLSLKHKQIVNITRNYLGLGDILFLWAIAFYLSPANYILFYIASLILILIYTIARRIVQKNANPEIPLAGLQALLLSMILIVSVINPNLQPYTDSWIYGF